MTEKAKISISQRCMQADRPLVEARRKSMMNRTPDEVGMPLMAPIWELAGLVLLLVFCLLVDQIFGAQSDDFINVAGPLWLTTILWLGAFRMAWLDAGAIWTALFWFRVATGLYFGVGALVPVLANDD